MKKTTIFQFLFLILIICSCRVLPKSLNENSVTVIANYKWIGKMGSMTISQGAAKPLLVNIRTGKEYLPDYKKKSFTFYYNLEIGTYIVKEIILDGGQTSLHLKTDGRTMPFEIERNGVFFIGGIDIVDYQFRMEYKIHDSIQTKQDLITIKNILSSQTNFPESTEIEFLDSILVDDK